MIEPYARVIRDAAPSLEQLNLSLTSDRDYSAYLRGPHFSLEIALEPTYRPNINIDFIDSLGRRFWVFGLQKVLDPNGRATFAQALRKIKGDYDRATLRGDSTAQATLESLYAQSTLQTVLKLIAAHVDELTPVTSSIEAKYAREERSIIERVERGETLLD